MIKKVGNVLSLFDGMSCGQIALNRAGISYDKYYACEIDKYAIQVTMANYPDTIQLGSVTDLKASDLPKIDLLIGGSPCQGFSFAGKQLNFDDPRSKLFFEYVRLLKECKPKYFLLENVKMKKEYQDVISESLGVEPIEINSSLVSAQNRKRLYWCNWHVEQPEDKGILLKDIIEKDALPITLTERRTEEAKKIRREHKNKTGKDFSPRRAKELVKRNDGKSNCLTANLSNKEHLVGVIKNHGKYELRSDKAICVDANYHKGVDNHGQRTLIFKHGLEEGRWLHDGKNLSRNYHEGYRVYSFDGKASSLTRQSKGGKGGYSGLYGDKHKYRKLTPIECERLQAVPDNYTKVVSNTQRYKMLGNGWTVDVIAHIFSSMGTKQTKECYIQLSLFD